jgi:hypothetical protein
MIGWTYILAGVVFSAPFLAGCVAQAVTVARNRRSWPSYQLVILAIISVILGLVGGWSSRAG